MTLARNAELCKVLLNARADAGSPSYHRHLTWPDQLFASKVSWFYAEVAAADRHGQTPLFFALATQRVSLLLKSLLRKGGAQAYSYSYIQYIGMILYEIVSILLFFKLDIFVYNIDDSCGLCCVILVKYGPWVVGKSWRPQARSPQMVV